MLDLKDAFKILHMEIYDNTLCFLIGKLEVEPILTLPYPGGGHNDPPYQLWSPTTPRGRLGLVQYPYEFGHMGANYDLDPKKVSKGEWAFEVFWTELHITQDPDVV